MPDDEVAALLPHLEAALGWLGDDADPDRDGFLEYIDTSGHGLANQGWKDSGDAVRFRDGRRAEAPIALAEVQGYAYEAAIHGGGAARPRSTGPAPPAGWSTPTAWPGGSARAFWVDGRHGTYPALALDRDKRPVDSLTSNIGHLLGTGLLVGGGVGQRRRAAGHARHGRRIRPAHHVHRRRRLQPAVVSLRVDLGARHRDRRRRASPAPDSAPRPRAAWPAG